MLFSTFTRPALYVREFNETRLQVSAMGFRQVRVLGRDDNDAIPEILLALVIAQPLRHNISLADVAARIADGRLVFSEQQVSSGPLSLIALQQVSQV